eukprot:COSAG01_NODE_4225_length_5225_cov_8.859930_4_plen_65_part_00
MDAGSVVMLHGSAPVRADATDRVDEVEVQWEGQKSMPLLALQGRSVRMELTVQDVVIFSFGFQH